MNRNATIAALGVGLQALAMLVLVTANAPAAGCGSCHYRPGHCPTLINDGTFGYTQTGWQLWPGPLDPNTSYPAETARPATMPAAEGAPDTTSKSPPNKEGSPASKPGAKTKDKADPDVLQPASTYQLIPRR